MAKGREITPLDVLRAQVNIARKHGGRRELLRLDYESTAGDRLINATATVGKIRVGYPKEYFEALRTVLAEGTRREWNPQRLLNSARPARSVRADLVPRTGEAHMKLYRGTTDMHDGVRFGVERVFEPDNRSETARSFYAEGQWWGARFARGLQKKFGRKTS